MLCHLKPGFSVSSISVVKKPCPCSAFTERFTIPSENPHRSASARWFRQWYCRITFKISDFCLFMYIFHFVFVNIVIIIQDRRHVKLPADPVNQYAQIKLRFTGSPRTVTFAALIHVQVFHHPPSGTRSTQTISGILLNRGITSVFPSPADSTRCRFHPLNQNTLQPSRKPAHIRRIYTADPR